MHYSSTVTLASNGKYWQALYRDNLERRRAKRLGPKSALSRHQARNLCDRLAADLQANPAKADRRTSPTLSDYLKGYLESRTDLKSATRYLHDLTARYLIRFIINSRVFASAGRAQGRRC